MDGSLNPAIYALLIAFVANILLCPIIIPYLTKLKFGQYIRSDGPKEHLKKAGTPTMGGVMIILSFAIAAAFFLRDNYEGMIVVFTTVAFGVVGLMDDYIKVTKKRSLGLKAYQKIIMQLIITGVFVFLMYNKKEQIFPGGAWTELIVPFTHGSVIDVGILFVPLVFITILGTVNGVNLTDGLDGLASGVTVLVATFFVFAAWATGNATMPVIGAAVGSLLGFLLFNSHPARVIMGDTGSLALGGFISVIAILMRMPLFILIVGIIYLIETLSVMIQVTSYKLRKKRVFKMAPIHHSFELSGWSETKIVALFYIITAIACLIGYLAA